MNVIVGPAVICFTPETNALLKRLLDPQTLDDALMAVRAEEATAAVARKLSDLIVHQQILLLCPKPN